MKTQYEQLMEMGWQELCDYGLVKLTYEPRSIKGSWSVWANYRLPYSPDWHAMEPEYFSPESLGDMDDDNAVCDVCFQCVLAFRRYLKATYRYLAANVEEK